MRQSSAVLSSCSISLPGRCLLIFVLPWLFSALPCVFAIPLTLCSHKGDGSTIQGGSDLTVSSAGVFSLHWECLCNCSKEAFSMYLFTCFACRILEALGECLPGPCEPLIAEEKSPVGESWGKHPITNWALNEGHPCLCSAARKGMEERDPVVLQNCLGDTMVGEQLRHQPLCANFPPEPSNFFYFFFFFLFFFPPRI